MKIDASAWPPEKVATLELSALKALSENAKRYGASGLVELCEAELKSRNPKRVRQAGKGTARRSPTEVVIGYHFVCARDRGVTNLENGGFKSGSWVVAEANVEQSVRHGAYLALHESRVEPSYRQGRIVGYELAERNMLDEGEAKPQTRMGIEFLVVATDEPYDWVGDATGEKGYKWSDLAQTDGSASTDP